MQVELKSGLLRGVASLVFELRSFAHGAREDLALLQAKAVEKARLDARLTVTPTLSLSLSLSQPPTLTPTLPR